MFLFVRPFETTEENVRRLAQWPDITLPHLDCSYKGIKPIYCTQCKVRLPCVQNLIIVVAMLLPDSEISHFMKCLIISGQFVKSLHHFKPS